jgi:hypothetical protein
LALSPDATSRYSVPSFFPIFRFVCHVRRLVAGAADDSILGVVWHGFAWSFLFGFCGTVRHCGAGVELAAASRFIGVPSKRVCSECRLQQRDVSASFMLGGHWFFWQINDMDTPNKIAGANISWRSQFSEESQSESSARRGSTAALVLARREYMFTRLFQSFTTLLLFALLVPSIICAQSSAASKDLSGLVYGPNVAFWINFPKDWVRDTEIAKKFNIPVVLCPRGSSFQNAYAIMYANFISKEKNSSLDSVIKADIDKFKQKDPAIKVLAGKTLKTTDNKTATVQIFQSTLAAQKAEAVAYIEENKVFVILVLSAQSQKGFITAFPLFEELVGSYGHFTDDVKIEK